MGPPILCVTLLAIAPTTAQAVTASEQDWVVDSWQTDAGLPHNSVTALLQTRDHYLWLGTSNGLARFDGVRFTTFRALDNPGLHSNRILCLAEDQSGRLWAGTDDGGVVRYERGKFRTFTSADGLPADTVLSLGTDSSGQLWVGTVAGLARPSLDTNRTFFSPQFLAEAPVFAICQPQPKDAPMLFGAARGLFRFRQERLVPYPGTSGAPAATNEIHCLAEDRAGRLWAAAEQELTRLPGPDTARSTEASRHFAGKISALASSKTDQVWLGTSAGELFRVPTGTKSLDPIKVWQFPGPLTALCEDKEGNLWVGTGNAGLYRLKRRQLQWIPFSDELADESVAATFDTPEGELWLVSAEKKLYQCHDGRLTFRKYLALPEGAFVSTACKSATGEFWLGTLRDGLFALDSQGLHQWGERNGLSDSAISVLCADPAGGIWIGTRNGGLNYFKRDVVTRFNTPWGFGGNFACALAPDETGLWIGTSGDGLFRLNAGSFTRYGEAEGLGSGYVRTLLVQPDGVVWIGTSKGLCRVKGGKLKSLTGRNGLGEEPILQLRADLEDNLWIGCSSTIVRVRQEQLNAFADGRAAFLDAVPYGREDGLPNTLCVPQLQSKGAPDRPGPVWFWTTKGIVACGERRPAWNDLAPEVLLETVLVDHENVPIVDPIRVPPGRENLEFQYTALSLTSPGKVAFRYQLEGFDRDWSEATSIRAARYAKVAPGKYRFRVLARNNDGIWNMTGASVRLIVAPFWWDTLWFRVTSVAAVSGLAAGFYRLRQARQRELERLRARIASDLHDDIGSSLWSITLLSRMLARHGSLGAEERDDVNEIQRISVQASNSIRDIIWLINPAFDTLQDLLLRVKDLAGTMLRDTQFTLKSDGPDLSRRLPLNFRQNLFFIFKEALTNIARHAQATEVEVKIEQGASRWRLTIRDNGSGFQSEKEHTGNGLKNLRSRAAKIGAGFEIRSHPSQGTTLIFDTNPP